MSEIGDIITVASEIGRMQAELKEKDKEIERLRERIEELEKRAYVMPDAGSETTPR